MLTDSNLNNVNYHLIPRDKEEDQGADAAYVKILGQFDANSLDFVLVDGVYRDFVALGSLGIIRPGGILIVDNANLYLPSNSYSPSSRTFEQGPKGQTWAKVYEALSNWRSIWTSNGIFDTAFFFKP